MIVIYSGTIGISLQSAFEIINNEQNVTYVTKRSDWSVVGDSGLHKLSKRNATWVALNSVLAFKLTANDYGKIVEGFHKTEQLENVTFNHSLDLFKRLNDSKVSRIAKYYNSVIFKQGFTINNVGENIQQLYIIKEGVLKVERHVELKTNNKWPGGQRNWKTDLMKQLPSLTKGMAYGLHEMQNNVPIKCRISVESRRAHILSINITDLQALLLEEEINSLWDSKYLIRFPDESKIIGQVLSELKQDSLKQKVQKYFRGTVSMNRNRNNQRFKF